MPEIYIIPWINEFIKSHARSAPKEIYGWLVGFESPSEDISVITAISCERYKIQHYTGAAPDPLEIQEISSSIPQGLGIIGVYHSHPEKVFHSATDDKTLINLSKYYPKMLSAVTNGSITKWYQLSVDGASKEIEIKKTEISVEKVKFLKVFARLDFTVPVKVRVKFIPQISKQLIDGFNDAWENGIVELIRNNSSFYGIHNGESINIEEILKTEDTFSKKGTKTVRKTTFKDLSVKDFKKLMKSDIDLKIHMKININKSNNEQINEIITTNNNEISEKFTDNIIMISGEIPVIGVIMLNRENYGLYLAKLMEKVKFDLLDDLKFKVSKGLLKYFFGSKQIKLISPNTILIPYPQTILKIRILLKKIEIIQKQFEKEIFDNYSHLPGFKKENLPSTKRLIELENSMLNSLYKRILALARSGKTKFGISLLHLIAKIYQIRGQNKEYNKILNVINLYKN
ncbi:MAG: Mov34/MPN/PAD-1 family protein [Promethearchaeota archaeon]